jgi:hypothetical protein
MKKKIKKQQGKNCKIEMKKFIRKNKFKEMQKQENYFTI